MLKLIYSASERVESHANSPKLHRGKVCLLAGSLFLLLKLPMCFVPETQNETRELQTFSKTAQGENPYRMAQWSEGPVAPLVFGTLLRVLPAQVRTIRLASLVFWTVGSVFIALILNLYFQQYLPILLGTLLATSVLGYCGETHGDVFAGIGLIVSAYFFLRFLDEPEEPFLLSSFGAALLCFFTHPVLMGYGIIAAWFALFFLQTGEKQALQKTGTLMIGAVAVTGVFLLMYGFPMGSAFSPLLLERSVASVNLVAIPTHSILVTLRSILETSIFYGHFFIWPTFLLTIAYIFKYRARMRAAVTCTVFGLLGSIDVLRNGFADPSVYETLSKSSPYFFALTACGLVLLLWPSTQEWKKERVKYGVSAGTLILVGLWGYLPWLNGLRHL